MVRYQGISLPLYSKNLCHKIDTGDKLKPNLKPNKILSFPADSLVDTGQR